MKLATIIITYNIPSEIFILQIQALRKFCQDQFVIEIFDNSTDEAMAEAIRYHADRLEVNYRKVYASQASGSESHSFAAQFSYDLLKSDYDAFFYLDHDCAPIKEFSVKEILGNKLYAGIAQKTPTYLWPGCFMFKNNEIDRSLIDFSPNHELGLDTGGNLYKLVEALGKENGIFFSEEYHENQHFKGKAYNVYAVIQKTFMHFIAASNWIDLEGHQVRINGLIAILKEKAQL